MNGCRAWVLIGIMGILISACGQSADRGDVEPAAIPAEYAGRTNPFGDDEEAALAGQDIYAANCAACHGVSGLGDGPAAAGLDPKPSNLVQAAGELAEGYFFWRTSAGGRMPPFNSAMPGWKGILSEEEIWQVAAYLQ